MQPAANAADAVLAFLSTDGFNQLGDMGSGYDNGNPYNHWNYSDPRPRGQAYVPVNTAYNLTDPSRCAHVMAECFAGGLSLSRGKLLLLQVLWRVLG